MLRAALIAYGSRVWRLGDSELDERDGDGGDRVQPKEHWRSKIAAARMFENGNKIDQQQTPKSGPITEKTERERWEGRGGRGGGGVRTETVG